MLRCLFFFVLYFGWGELVGQSICKVGDATLVARRSTLEARKNEAAEDKDGFGTEGEALPGEMYSAERDWVSEEFLEADATEKGQSRYNTEGATCNAPSRMFIGLPILRD